jgi:sporulation protein YlmC with PRC-barrel domain
MRKIFRLRFGAAKHERTFVMLKETMVAGTLAVALAVTPGAVLAQSPSAPAPAEKTAKKDPTNTTSAPSARRDAGFVVEQKKSQWLTKDVVGQSVIGPNGKSIGEVQYLVIGKDGRVEAAVIGVGGFLGLGEKHVAVPYDAINKSISKSGMTIFRLAKTADELQQAPKFATLADQVAEEKARQIREQAKKARESAPVTTPRPPRQSQ